jgi:hypothetical protein
MSCDTLVTPSSAGSRNWLDDTPRTTRPTVMVCSPRNLCVQRICRGFGPPAIPCPAFPRASTQAAAYAQERRCGRVNCFSSATSPSGSWTAFACVRCYGAGLRILGTCQEIRSIQERMASRSLSTASSSTCKQVAAPVDPGATTPGGGRQNQTDRIATKGKAR